MTLSILHREADELREIADAAPDLADRLNAIADALDRLHTRPSRDARLAARDHAIRRLLELTEGATLSRRADALAQSLTRYLAGRWRTERDSGPRPGASERDRLLWRIADLGEGRSLTSRQIRNIHASHRGAKVGSFTP